MATDISNDPNAITDPTGGAPNFNILDVFQEFGYQPTQAEIDALAPSFEGTYGGGGIGSNAVAQYVNYQNQIKAFQANDPLTGLQTRMNNIITQNTASVANLQTQLQSVLTSAPQLFGNLTPDQISTYLKPLQTSFTQQLSQVQGSMASRGLAASSTEANAENQTNEQFQEQTLNTGLQIGLTSQQNQAQALQAQINNLFGQTNTAMGISGQAAGQQSGQNLGISQLFASLPSFLNAQSAQEEQQATINANKGGFQSEFNTVTGDTNSALGTATNLLNFGKQFASSNVNAGPSGNVGLPQGSPSAQAPLFNSSQTPGYQSADQGSLSLLQETGSAFGS
jgi:hypothetical protein